MLKKTILMLVITVCVIPLCFAAPDYPAKVKSDLEARGLPVLPGAIYCTGYANTGVRFATDRNPDKVKKWYRTKFPKWSVMDQYGSWILHDGPPNAGVAQVMSGKQILIQKNELLPSWHSLSSDMTTEIMATFPD